MKSSKSKTAAKKKASKQAVVGDPNAKALPALIKILYKGPKDEEFTAWKQSDLFEKRGKALGVDAGIYRSMMRARANNVKQFDDGGNEKAKKAWIAAGKDWTAHTEEKSRIETTKAAEEKSRLDAKAKAEAAMVAARESGNSTDLVTSMKSKMEDLVSSNLKKHGIAYKDGKFSLAKGTKVTPELIAGALDEMSGMAAGSSELRDVACIAEARLAIFIQDELKVANWTDYFSDDQVSILRIKKYMTSVRRAGEITVTVGGEEKTVAEVIESGAMSFSNARTVLEAKFDKEDAKKNTATRAEVLQKVIDEGESSGSSIPQTRVRSIVTDTKNEAAGSVVARKPFGVFYVLISSSGSIAVVGREKAEKVLDQVASIIIDKGKQEFVDVINGRPSAKIEEPTAKQWEWIHAQVKSKGIEGDFTEKELKEAGKKEVKKDKKAPDLKVVKDEEEVEVDLDSLSNSELAEMIDEAGENAEEAETILRKRCEVAGVDADDADTFETWDSVASALDDMEVDQTEEETEEEDTEEGEEVEEEYTEEETEEEETEEEETEEGEEVEDEESEEEEEEESEEGSSPW